MDILEVIDAGYISHSVDNKMFTKVFFFFSDLT